MKNIKRESYAIQSELSLQHNFRKNYVNEILSHQVEELNHDVNGKVLEFFSLIERLVEGLDEIEQKRIIDRLLNELSQESIKK